MAEESFVSSIAGKARQHKHAYAEEEDRPLGSYAALITLYSTVGIGALAAASTRKRDTAISASDIALIAVATFKASRVITKGTITSPLRAPFVRFAGVSGPSELKEEMRVEGPLRAVGELLTCPFCISQWLATGFTFGLVLAPRATRLAATVLTSVTAADFLQFARAGAEQHT